nr:zinc finger protein 33B-like [Misgurnus anguillicaudatus]
MCSVKLVDCRNLKMKIKTKPIEEENRTEDFILPDVKSDSCSDEGRSSTSKERLTAQTQEKKLHSEEQREKKKKKKQQFHCEHCGKNFVYLSQLKAHTRTHSDEKPFYCTECGNYLKPNIVLMLIKEFTQEKKHTSAANLKKLGIRVHHNHIRIFTPKRNCINVHTVINVSI